MVLAPSTALAVDSDGDGIDDEFDNCPSDYNPAQDDVDADGVGDVCDNCPELANPDQWDNDADGMGDVCDPCPDDPYNECDEDADGDGIPDAEDNCPSAYNPNQEDTDNDGVGDACDNCPNVANPGQENQDGDDMGDACDPDDDDDGILDDGDASGVIGDNPCTGGATMNCDDNCTLDYNPFQEDQDEDGMGDVCDPCPTDPTNSCGGCPDGDGDGVCDDEDNCPNVVNPGQEDADADGLGDACDPCPSDPTNLCPPCVHLPAEARSWWPGDGHEEDIIGANTPVDTIGSPSFEAAWVRDGMRFLGTDGWVTPDDGYLDIDPFDSIAVLAWVRVDSIPEPGESAVLDKRTGGPDAWTGYLLSAHAGNDGEKITFQFSVSDGITTYKVSAGPVKLGTFHHVAVVIDALGGETLAIWLDGRLADLRAKRPDMDASNDAGLHIGHPVTDAAGEIAGLDGIVDELHWFYRDLSWCELRAIRGAGKHGVCRDDRDADDVVDYFDNCPDLANSDQMDADADSAGDICDCRWDDWDVHHAPGETGGMRVGVDLERDRLGWCGRKADCGSETVFTVVRGLVSELPVGSGGGEICFVSGFYGTRYTDGEIPPENEAYWYILRAHNPCGVGTYGYATDGTERMPLTCALSEEELCGDTGGYWDIGSCGHYECGAKPDCDAIIPGCDCGPVRNFAPGQGCFHDPSCP